MTNAIEDIWESTVRTYEVDYQGIVNNANYLHYLENARAILLKKINLNVNDLAKNNINFVLMKTEITFKKSLVAYDEFIVKTSLLRESKFKVKFSQKITLKDEVETICVFSESIAAAIDSFGNPQIVKELEALL